MKRRKFLKITATGAGLAGITSTGSLADDRLFGSPMYLQGANTQQSINKLRLVLGRIEMPLTAWEPLTALAQLWGEVFVDEPTRQEFLSAPRRFLRRHGVPSAVIRQHGHEIRLLELVADPYVQHLASAGKYREFLNRLKTGNLLHDDAEDSLRRRVMKIIETDREQLQRQITATGLSLSDQIDFSSSAELYAITRELAAVNQVTQSVAAAVVVVVVAALAATYVSVGVNVTVALNLGVTISVAVSTAVTTGGGGGGFGGCNYCHADIGGLAALEPKMQSNLNMTIRAARLTGRKSFEAEALKDYIAGESRACLEAAEELGVITLPLKPQSRQVLLDSVGRLTCKAAGLV